MRTNLLALVAAALSVFAAACVHTRESAQPRPHPREWTTMEGEDTSGTPENRTIHRLANLVFHVNLYATEHGLPGSLVPVLASSQRAAENNPDAWGHDFQLSGTAARFELRSPGQDAISGTADDIIAFGHVGRSYACQIRTAHTVITPPPACTEPAGETP